MRHLDVPSSPALFRLAAVALAAGAVGACGGGGGGGGIKVMPAPFQLTVEPAVSGHQGAETLAAVQLTRDAGFTDRVIVSVKDGAPGISAAEVVLTGARLAGWLRLAVAPGTAVGGPIHLTVVATSDAAGAGQATAPLDLNVLGADAVAQDKIEAARAAGTVDDGTALLYRAYALFGDTRLPEAYRGAGSAEEDNGLLPDIRQAWDGLSADAQTALHPFTVRPSEPDSWYTPPATQASAAPSAAMLRALGATLPPTSCADFTQSGFAWISRRSATNPVRVWVSCNGDAAHDQLATEALEETLAVLDRIWGPETALMNPPIFDGTDGGDDAIDVYIDSGFGVSRDDMVSRPIGLGTTFPDQTDTGMSAFIVLPEILLGSVRFHPTIIHELFHVLQLAHNPRLLEPPPTVVAPTRKGYWFYEASATWASQYFDRTLAPWPRGRGGYQDAHMRFLRDFQPSALGLNSHAAGAHTYAAYIWPYFVEQSTNGPDFVGRAWKALESAGSFEQADDAVDSAYPFIDHFREFALRNVNTGLVPGDPLPQAKRYIGRDPEFRDDMKEPPVVASDVAGEFEGQEFTVGLPPLTARYLKFTVSNKALVQIVFDTSDFTAWPGLDVDVLVKVNGTWEAAPRNLNGKPALKFCRDKPDQKVDEVRFILANHQRKAADVVTTSLRVSASTVGCQGTWHGTSYTSNPPIASGNNPTCTADVTWVFDPIESDSMHEHYIGHGTVKYTTDDPAYTYDPSTATINPGDGAMVLPDGVMDVRPDPSGTGFFITGGGTTYFPTTQTWDYLGVLNVKSTYATCSWFSAGDNGTKISDDGTTASADMTTAINYRYGFSFAKD